jgi:hypothetical protein
VIGEKHVQPLTCGAIMPQPAINAVQKLAYLRHAISLISCANNDAKKTHTSSSEKISSKHLNEMNGETYTAHNASPSMG